MKRPIWMGLVFLCILVSSVADLSAEQTLSVGYGFGVMNTRLNSGILDDGKYYDFWEIAYTYERAFWQNEKAWWKDIAFNVMPYVAYVATPTDGFEGGFILNANWYFVNTGPIRIYFGVGAGLAYTTIHFQEQGTHFLGSLSGALGLKYKSFFVENRFRHYSNGNTAHPNRSVNANIVSVGVNF